MATKPKKASAKAVVDASVKYDKTMKAAKKDISKRIRKMDKKTTPRHPLMINGQSWDRRKVMDVLCQRIASCTKSIATILKEGHEGSTLPDYVTIKAWLAEDRELSTQYARAKEDQAEYMAEEMMEISDAIPLMHPITGAVDPGSVQHARLRAETRKWLMGKLKPKKYGDKLDLNHSGNIGIESLIAGAGDDTSSD